MTGDRNPEQDATQILNRHGLPQDTVVLRFYIQDMSQSLPGDGDAAYCVPLLATGGHHGVTLALNLPTPNR